MQRKYIGIGAILMAIAVMLGAFGAHVLKTILDDKAIATFQTGVHYHMIHALAIIIVSLIAAQWGTSRSMLWANRLFLLGIILFSGSLYVMSVTGWKWLGPITPLGGVSFIVGWLLVAVAAWGKSGKSAK